MTNSSELSDVTLPRMEEENSIKIVLPTSSDHTPTVCVDGHRWTIWTSTVRNPSCGWISLEKGTRLFLCGYVILMTLSTAFWAFDLLRQLLHIMLHTSRRDHKKFSIIRNDTMSSPAGRSTISGDNNRAVAYVEDAFVDLFLGFISGFTAYSAFQCLQALKQGVVPKMKRHFYVLLVFVGFELILTDFCGLLEEVTLWILLDVLFTLFSVIGLLFTFYYILWCIEKATKTGNGDNDASVTSSVEPHVLSL